MPTSRPPPTPPIAQTLGAIAQAPPILGQKVKGGHRYTVADTYTSCAKLIDAYRQIEAPAHSLLAPRSPLSADIYIGPPPKPVSLTGWLGTWVESTRALMGFGAASAHPKDAKILEGDSDKTSCRASADPQIQCMVYLADRGWSSHGFRLAEEEFGEACVMRASAQSVADIIALRRPADTKGRTPRSDAQKQLDLNLALNHIAAAMPDASRKQLVASKTFSGTPFAHAAHHLDDEALTLLVAGAPNAQQMDAFDATAGKICFGTLMTWMALALESPYFAFDPEAGRRTLRCVLHTLRQFDHSVSWTQQLETQDSFIRVIIKSRNLEALPCVAEVYHALRARVSTPECDYLIWAVNDGWDAGVDALLALGLSPNDRASGCVMCHATFSFGITPLMAALSAKNITHAMSLKIAKSLVDYGANIFLTAASQAEGGLVSYQFDARVYCRLNGLMPRWDMFERRFEFLTNTARKDAFADRITVILVAIRELAEGLPKATIQQAKAKIIEVLSQSHRLFYADYAIKQTFGQYLDAFLVTTAELFCDIPIPARPHRRDVSKESTQKGSRVFMGQTFALEDATLPARFEAWCDYVRAPNFVEETLRGPVAVRVPPSTRVTDWINEVAQVATSTNHIRSAQGLNLALDIIYSGGAQVTSILDADESNKPKALSMALLAIYIEASRSSEAESEIQFVRLAKCIIDQGNDVKIILAQLEVALRVGKLTWVESILGRVQDMGLQLVEAEASTQTMQNLLHVAAESSNKTLKAFCIGINRINPAWRKLWMSQQDDAGDTPLHVAGRIGLNQVKVLMQGLNKAAQTASVSVLNSCQRPPSLEALIQNQVAAFAYLARMGEGLATAEALELALSSRRGVLGVEVMQSLMAHPRGTQMLRTHAAALARRFARLDDEVSLATLATHFMPEILAAQSGRGTLLHAIAHADSAACLAQLTQLASSAQLQALAKHPDAGGRLAEYYAEDTRLREALTALCRAGPPARVVGPTMPGRWTALRHATRAVAKASQGATLDKAIKAFIAQADADLLKDPDATEARQRVIDHAWQVVDHIDRAPTDVGTRLGVHLAMHRPEMHDEALRTRAESNRVGATRFGKTGALALLRGRAKAILQGQQMRLQPGMRAVIDVPAPGLGGTGYVWGRAGLVRHDGLETLRTVFAQTHQGLVLVTSYPA